MIQTKGNHAWAQKLTSLTEKSILWYPKKINTKGIIFRCGSFYNALFIGSNGCINYNPIITMSELGYSAWYRSLPGFHDNTFGIKEMPKRGKIRIFTTEFYLVYLYQRGEGK